MTDPDYSRRGFLTKAGVTLGAAPLIGLVKVEDALAVPPPTVYDVRSRRCCEIYCATLLGGGGASTPG